jgi:hypothetical protein
LDAEKFVAGDFIVDIREDPNEGTIITVNCPSGCNHEIPSENIAVISSQGGSVNIYPEDTPICAAAFHAGFLNNSGGLVDVVITTLKPESELMNSARNETQYFHGVGQFYKLMSSSSKLAIRTISGAPSSLVENPCGFNDSIPSQGAKVRST